MIFLNGSRLEFNYSKQRSAVFSPDTNIDLQFNLVKVSFIPLFYQELSEIMP